MSKKKYLNTLHYPARVLEARAGIIPASDHIQHRLNLRTASIGRTVKTYAHRERGRHDLAITEILQDLRHYCDSQGLAFQELDRTAAEYYQEDVNESPWISRLQGD
jgi:hypothetical protein